MVNLWVFTQKRHVWQCKTMLFLSANHVVLCHFRTKNDAHYLVRRHNALYDRLLQLHTYFAHIFVQMILIFKYSSFRASAKFNLTCKCRILSQSGKLINYRSIPASFSFCAKKLPVRIFFIHEIFVFLFFFLILHKTRTTNFLMIIIMKKLSGKKIRLLAAAVF